MRKSFKYALVSLLVALIVGGLIFAYSNRRYMHTIRINWSINLPDSNKEIYSKNWGMDWMGDGESYHVFQYHDNKIIIKSLDWNEGSNISMESEVLKLIDTLGVSKEYIPDFQDSYKYFTKIKTDGYSTIYLIYFEDTKKLYVIENIF